CRKNGKHEGRKNRARPGYHEAYQSYLKHYSGIAFSVYAGAIYAVHNIAGDTSFTDGSLAKLEATFDKLLLPFPRSFDSFPVHSWAQGILEAPDGKDQEFLAVDAFSTYAIKMWGKVSGDASLEAPGNLQLEVTARSLQSCFLLASDKNVQPSNFVGNRATGILWDKKVYHSAYFGDEIAYSQGFHMLPTVPSGAYIRQPFSLSGGFTGYVYANLVIADKVGAIESHAFFRKQTDY
ncbi:glycosyl hydrolase family 81, partial [Fusarium pseudocircinatum]